MQLYQVSDTGLTIEESDHFSYFSMIGKSFISNVFQIDGFKFCIFKYRWFKKQRHHVLLRKEKEGDLTDLSGRPAMIMELTDGFGQFLKHSIVPDKHGNWVRFHLAFGYNIGGTNFPLDELKARKVYNFSKDLITQDSAKNCA